MRAVAYSNVERSVARALQWDSTNLDAVEFGAIRDRVSEALEEIWTAYWWPETMRVEQRFYRDDYDAAETYAAGDEVYFPGTQSYFQALRASTGNAPATKSGTDWTLNAAYWAAAVRAPEAEDYSATTTYAVGDQVYWDETDSVYQMHTLATAGTDPDATSAWGVVNAFDVYIALVQTGQRAIGRVRSLAVDDPRKYVGAEPVTWQMSERGIEPYTDRPWVWVEYQTRPHQFVGDAWSATLAYTVTSAESGTSSTAVVVNQGRVAAYPGVAALRAETSHRDLDYAFLDYVATPGDGGQGPFVYDADETAADDGVNILKPDDVGSGNPGRWKRR